MYKKACIAVFLCLLLVAANACAVDPELANLVPSESTQIRIGGDTLPKETSMPVAEIEIDETVSTEDYVIFEENGRYYMRFHGTKSNGSAEDNALQSIGYPEFTSVKEMKQALLAGDFTERELQALRAFAVEQTDTVEICNVETFYEARVPASTTVEYIQFFGNGYSFHFSAEEMHGLLYYVSKEDYIDQYKTIYEGEGMSKNIEVISDEVSSDGKTSVLRYRHWGNEFKKVRYPIQTEHGEIYVLQSSQIIEDSGNIRESNRSVRIFGVNDGAYFYVWVTNLEEDPTEEWLSSFGLREYVETEVS